MDFADQADHGTDACEKCFVHFTADGVPYLAPLDDVRYAQVAQPDNMPLVRLDAHVGVREAVTHTSCYLVLGREEAPFALAVEEVYDVVTTASSLLHTLPERVVSPANTYVTCVACQSEGSLAYVIDVARLRASLGGDAA